ncbi:molybdenum cofactor synthesis domain-containing protein [Sphaerochaeta halotolerans]|jgi:molybdenum cofactor synthesis domain-containing protein|nr:molybdenum cofactor synthesis domain-containing protein [Sphaerochaeta halotolerans]
MILRAKGYRTIPWHLWEDEEMQEGTIIAVCASKGKGTAKEPMQKSVIKADWGIENDAHAGNWHRQISLLSYEKVEAFRSKGAPVKDGDFGENLLVQGIDFRNLPIGAICKVGDVVLEITQIGKECHSGCDIFQKMGTCIMPKEGVFARVLHGGTVQPAMTMQVFTKYRVFILCASDQGYAKKRVDESTGALVRLMEAHDYEVVGSSLLPDDRAMLSAKMAEVCDTYQADLLLTTGGTGLASRDVTPEATLDISERLVPGLSELMRMRCLTITDRASLSRGICATRRRTLIVNLPGSPRAAVENLEAVLSPLEHGMSMLTGRMKECASVFGAENTLENIT